MKQFIKKITPPIIYMLLRKFLVKPKTFSPIWNTLTYNPLNGIQIFFDPSGLWQKKIMNNTYDKFLFDRLSKTNLEGKIVFDIGAHIGFHSIYFARLVGPNGKIYSFEPNPKNIERFKIILEKNEDIRKIISVFDIAVSDNFGFEKFNMSEDIESGRSSGGFIDTADPIWDKEAFKQRGFTETNVKTIPTDLFKEKLEIQDAPDIIKIDVEGAEFLILLGAKNILLNKKPIIFLEIHSMKNMFNVVYFLSSLSYKLEILEEEKDGRIFIEAKPKK